MSWFSKNYEKVTLGGAVAVAIGFTYLGWAKYSNVDDDFGPGAQSGGGTMTAVAGSELIPKAQQSMKHDLTWKQALDVDRPVDLFTGIALFVKKSESEKSVDLLKGDPVHPPIPNTWWLEHRLDPGYADAPDRDPDGDGFTNLEEYKAGTDPNDPKSYPSLIAKLMYQKDESLAWVVRPGYGGDGGKFPFTYEDSLRRNNRIPAGEDIGPGELFFKKEPMVDRFKFLGTEVRKEMNKQTHTEEEVTYTRIEDQRPNKKGVVYEIPAPLAEQRRKEYVQYDRTAVFSLEALGKNGAEFKVEENTAFALPPDAPKKEFFLKKVTPDSVTLEYTDSQGKNKTLELQKGMLPHLDQ